MKKLFIVALSAMIFGWCGAGCSSQTVKGEIALEDSDSVVEVVPDTTIDSVFVCE